MRRAQRWRSGFFEFLLCLSAIGPGSACTGVEGEQVGVASDEIVGGQDTTIVEHPWQIALTTKSAFQFCGGSILNPSWVLTAQHCLAGGSADMRVVAGITRKSQQSSGQIRAIDGFATFPGFADPVVGKDAALVHLASPLDLSGPNANSIALVSPADAAGGAADPGIISTVTGWGTLSSGGTTPDVLQEVDIPLVSNEAAQAAYPQETITDDQIGAGIIGVGGVDSCQGDSGGPLTVPFGDQTLLGGLVSWGYGCADPTFPGMYARVSSFAPWITARATGTFTTVLRLAGLSGLEDVFTHRTVTVPPGAITLSVVVDAGTGDADLYVRRAGEPNLSAFDCRPFLDGSNEFCTIDSPAADTWFVSIAGYRAYSGVSLTVAVVTPPVVTP